MISYTTGLVSTNPILTHARKNPCPLKRAECPFCLFTILCLYNKVRDETSKRSPSDREDDVIYGIALDESINFIQDCSTEDDSIPVFKLSDLKRLFRNRLKEYGASKESIDRVHRTRLKAKILEQLPELNENRKGKEVLLTYKDETGDAIFGACNTNDEDDGKCLARAAKLLQRQMFAAELTQENENILSFKGDKLIPASLHSFISILLGNTFIEEDDNHVGNEASMAIAHFIRFNTVKKERKPGGKGVRHT